MRFAPALAAAALVSVAPAFADGHAQHDDALHNDAMHSDNALAAAIASDIRADDMARDQYRHPAETLKFFQVEPDMKIGEYAPGGGWYTRILAPYVGKEGEYVALWYNLDEVPFPDDAKARIAARSAGFADEIAAWTGMEDGNFSSMLTNEASDEDAGTFDRIMIFRSLHGLSNWNMIDSELKAMRDLLKDDGMLGIVQHRAADDANHTYSTGPRGYVSQDAVINLAEFYGFELVGMSDINANPNDTADHEVGVWYLPPSFSGTEDTDTQERAARIAIGESDRMTLLFRKK